MSRAETHLEQAERHVSENGARVARQKELIGELERDGHAEMLPAAEELLKQLEAIISSTSGRRLGVARSEIGRVRALAAGRLLSKAVAESKV